MRQGLRLYRHTKTVLHQLTVRLYSSPQIQTTARVRTTFDLFGNNVKPEDTRIKTNEEFHNSFLFYNVNNEGCTATAIICS